MANKIDSNVVGTFIAEESSLKTVANNATWYEAEPNSFSKFGSDVSTVARKPINAARQRKKGTVTGITANGDFNTDVTQHGLARVLQGFFFADAHEKPSTQPLNGAAVALTSATSPGNNVTAASGLSVFKVNQLVLLSGFGSAANNGLTKLSAVAAGSVTTVKNLAAEAAPPASAKVEAVGFEFPSGDLSLTASASSIVLTSAATNLTTLGLIPGEWVFIGGDNATNQFAANAPGYARIKAITAATISFDDTTFAPLTDAGAGKSVQMFFGTNIRNESVSTLIKRRSYQVERQLGADADGIQSEYLIGAIPDSFKLAIPKKDKLNADLSFVAMDAEYRTGVEGVKPGPRVAALGESAFNSSSDIYRLKMAIIDPVTLNPSALFGYVSEATVEIKNNVTADTAIGTVGAFDATAGDFEVSGTATAYFSTVAAVQAIRNNADVSFNMIAAQNNAGFVADIPLLTLSGGQPDVKKDAPITLALKNEAAMSAGGYTMLTTWFNYLPLVGMPD